MPSEKWYVALFKEGGTGELSAHCFMASDDAHAGELVRREVCPDEERLVSLEPVLITENDGDASSELLARLYLQGYNKCRSEVQLIGPYEAWRALVACDMGNYVPVAVDDVIAGLNPDPDVVNGCKALLNASGVVTGGQLAYDGNVDDDYVAAIRALAAAAEVDEHGDLPTQTM